MWEELEATLRRIDAYLARGRSPEQLRLEMIRAADELRQEAEQATDPHLRSGLLRSAEILEERAGSPPLRPLPHRRHGS